MSVFIDSDIILDFLTGRDFFLEEIRIIFDKGIKQEIELFTSPLIIANVHYFISKTENVKKANDMIRKLLQIVQVLDLGENEIRRSLDSKFKDFEDGIQNFCAVRSQMKVIVTRNVRDFKSSDLSILNPKECLVSLGL